MEQPTESVQPTMNPHRFVADAMKMLGEWHGIPTVVGSADIGTAVKAAEALLRALGVEPVAPVSDGGDR